MKSPPKNVSEDDDLTITQRNTRLKTSMNGREYSEPIPIDLIIEIFLKLSAKSIAKCCCVSKIWASILRRPDFTELFLTRSPARPHFLFACQKNRKLFFYSAPQPQNPNDNSSSIAATYHMNLTFIPHEQISHVNGLVLVRDWRIVEGRKRGVLVTSICNPSTGQSLTLPKVKTRRRICVKTFSGYDPIGKQYKILSMTSMVHKRASEEHQVLTLGTEKPSWRMIDCCIPHYSLMESICVNGVLYYTATYNMFPLSYMIVCFDVRSEKFRSIKLGEDFGRAVCYGSLINYNGKLASVLEQRSESGTCRGIKLWVLEDAEKEEWSEHTNVFSASCQNVVGRTDLSCVGVTRTNEIVLSPCHQTEPFYVFYYNIERNSIARVEIQGIDASKNCRLRTFIDHVEDVKLI